MLYTSYMNKKYLIELIKSVILSKQPPEKPDEVSFEEIFKISKIHNIANLVYYAIAKLENKPDEKLLKLWKREKSLGMRLDVIQSTEFLKLKLEFEKNSIKYIPLKGFELKKLYPKSDMRKMGDIDILIQERDRKKVKLILQELGYSISHYDGGKDDGYLKYPFVNVEIHNNLFDEDDKVYYNYFYNLSNFNRVKYITEYECCFSIEDNYIYNFIHMLKHFETYGTGIRSVLDHWLYIKKLGNQLNWEYINKVLKDLNLTKFHEKFSTLSKVWFEEEKGDIIIDNLEEYIINSGNYGDKKNRILNIVTKNNKQRELNKIVTLLRMIFPNIEIMKTQYPILKKRQYFLLYFYIVRIFKILFFKRKEKVITIKTLMNLERDKIKTREDFFCSIGLYDLYKKK